MDSNASSHPEKSQERKNKESDEEAEEQNRIKKSEQSEASNVPSIIISNISNSKFDDSIKINIVNQYKENVTEEEKQRKIIEDFSKELKKGCLSFPMKNVPWLDKELTIEGHYIDLRLVTENINGRDIEQRQIRIHDLIESINNRKKNIFIEGKPGYGKTSLVYKIAKLWAERKLRSYDLLFIIELRNHNFDSVEGFLLNQWLKLNIKGYYEEEILKAIQNSKVLLVLDGLDEVPVSKKNSTIEFIKEIQGNENFHILFTSRPTNQMRDYNLAYSEKIVSRGFSKDKKQEFIKQYFDTDTHHIEETLENNNRTSELSQCPLMLLLFCILIEQNERTDDLPDTFTDLYKTIVNFVIKRVYEKKGRNYEKLDLFETKKNKESKQLFDILCRFGEKAFEAIQKNKVIFEKQEIKGAFLLKMGFLIECSSDDTLLEPFHKSFSEFSCALYLYKLFLENEERFNEIFLSFLIEIEKEDSLILPFLCGLLKDKSEIIIKLLPDWFYFGNWSNSLILIEECREFLTNKDILHKLIPCDLHLDISINDDNQVVTFENRLRWKVTDREKENKSHVVIINVLHDSSQNDTSILDLTNLSDFSCGIVRLRFPCQSKDRSNACHEKPFSQSQLIVLMDEILKINPRIIGIQYPHCNESISVLVDRISKTNVIILEIGSFHFLNEDIIAISHILQNLRRLYLSTEMNELSVRDNNSPSNVQIQPLIDAMKSPECQLKRLYLTDVFVYVNEFRELIDCLSQSETITELIIHFTSLSPHVIDLNDLCKEGKKWERVDLKNIRVIVSKHSRFFINSLSSVKCFFTEQEDAFRLFSSCEMKLLKCDSQLLNSFPSLQSFPLPLLLPSSQTLKLLVIEDEIINVSPQVISNFINLRRLSFDLKEGFQMSSINKQNLILLLLQMRTGFGLDFILTFDTKEYLKQIDFIIDLMENISENYQSRAVKIHQLRLTFFPQKKAYNRVNATVLNRKETEELLVHISKICPYLFNGLLSELVLWIQQSNQGGHYFGPFLRIKDLFSEKKFIIEYEFDSKWGTADWTIKKIPIVIPIRSLKVK